MTIEFQPPPADLARSVLTSDCVTVDGWCFVNGVGPIDLQNDRAPLPEMVEAQVRKCLANLEAIIAPHGLGREHVVSVRMNIVDYARLHERVDLGYAGFFTTGRAPTRSVVGVSQLPRGALVNCDFIARRSERA